jgi:hypothetical protein
MLLALAACAHRSWNEVHAGFESASSRDCLACHETSRPAIQAHASHPLDVDYGEKAGRAGSGLRPLEEVRLAGVALPDGRLGCRTCHSSASPWKYHLAIPAGAEVRPAVDPGDPRTFESPPAERPAPGSRVSTKPLCQACHSY